MSFLPPAPARRAVARPEGWRVATAGEDAAAGDGADQDGAAGDGAGGATPAAGTRTPAGDVDIVGREAPAWEDVARAHGTFLYTVAYRLTGNQDDAADLVQEVLLRVRRGLPGFRPGSMEGWLSRITTNVFLDDVRRRRRRPVESLPEDAERVIPSTASAEDAHHAAVLSADIQAALLQLPGEFRAAVVLCDVAGLSYGEIGAALGVPIGTVRSRIHRGRALLREALR